MSKINFVVLITLICVIKTSVSQIFIDVTERSGIDFRHDSTKTDHKHIIETMGSGCVFFDHDNDGDQDLYLVNGGSNVLYENRNSIFTDVTKRSGVGDLGYGMGAVSGDYDNDGDGDLYVCNYGPDQLYQNNGDGTFTNVTKIAGIDNDLWAVAATFFDYDLDGDLDLYVCNYLVYDRSMPVTKFSGIVGYGHPRSYEGTPDRLYRNNSDGTFTDVSEIAGVVNAEEGRGMGVIAFDYDNDGFPDLYVPNDTNRNFLYRNNGDGTFTDEALFAGAGYDENGIAEGSMGIDCGDFDHDGWLDLIVANSETATLYRNDHDGFFTDVTRKSGLIDPTFNFVGFSPIWIDYDNDGHLDLFSVNGHPQDVIEKLTDQETYAQRDQLFHNDGNGIFTEILADQAGDYFSIALPGRATASADFDNDGDLDLFVMSSNERGVLLRNEIGQNHNWIRIILIGTTTNRDAIGSRARVIADGKTQMAEIKSGSSYSSDSDRRLLFGLGGSEKIDAIEIRWLSGKTQRLTNVKPNQTLKIYENR